MKKIINILSILVIVVLTITTKEVFADNYKMMELIPHDKKVTIRGDNFLYKDIEFKNARINIGQIKNISDEDKKITISLAFFDEDKNNITIINYCSNDEVLAPKQTKDNYEISIDVSKLAENKKIKDIKYYAVLSENKSCRLGGEKEFVGRKIDQINKIGDSELPTGAKLLLNVIKVVIGLLVVFFLYKLLFTSSYDNMNGDDVRKEFKYINKEKERERNKKTFINQNVKEEKKPTKSEKVLAQEKEENNKEKNKDSDLQNMYK